MSPTHAPCGQYGSHTVVLPGGIGSVIGGNPQKDSKWGRKLQAGGAVTFINPGGTFGYEPSCLVLEAATTTGPPTLSKGLNLLTANLLPNVVGEVANGTAGGLNLNDASRILDDSVLKRKVR